MSDLPARLRAADGFKAFTAGDGGRALNWEVTLKLAADTDLMLEAADYIEQLQAIVDQIPADRLNKWHTVTVSADGWHMAHPIFCDLTECPFDGLAQDEWTAPPTAAGVWRWHDFDDEPWDWEQVQP